MKLVMTLLVRDEADVLQANLDFHRAQGVDFFIVTDNRSDDSTAEIIQRYERDGLARYRFEPADDYDQSAWVTQMARLAASEHGADWVINNDADEFWWPREGNLCGAFAAAGEHHTTLLAERHDFVPLIAETAPFHQAMVYRKRVSTNANGKPLPPKVAHRADPDVVVQQGNHWAELPGGGECLSGAVDIFHFPLRRYAQFTNKIVKGGQAYARNRSADAAAGATWKRLYAEYQRNGLVDYYRRQCRTPDELEAGLRSGELVCDRRLADYLDRLRRFPAAAGC